MSYCHGGLRELMASISPLTPWVDRIKKILNFDERAASSVGWLLIPVDGDEVSDEEAQVLFEALRSHLFNGRSRPDLSTIKGKLHALSPDERIVLLYALRYIALKGAGQNRYWPLCHKMLFDEKIELQALQVSLAPEFTDQWFIFYRQVQGRLFFPHHGKRNIKWPLAHAGLLIRDKELLHHFHHDLARSWRKDEFQLLLEPDGIDDFALELEEWLKYNDAYESFAFAITSDERGLITLELAQHYLASIQNNQSDTDSSLVSTPLTRRTRNIVYNSYTQQIELHIRLYFATSQGDLSVEWQQHQRRCRMDPTHTRYDIVLPLTTPHWPEFATFTGEHRSEWIRLPKSIGSAPVVFDANTGQRVRTWQFGEEYYLLLPIKQRIDGDLQRLFASYEAAPSIVGAWYSHALWYVKIITLNGDTPQTLSEINELADTFDLPLFAYGEIHVQLVGGLLLHRDPPQYAFTEQPSIQLSGLWERELQIEHQVWDANQVRVLKTTTATVAPQVGTTTHVLRYEPSPIPITWHILLLNGRTAAQWGIVSNQTAPSATLLAATLKVYVDRETILTRISSQDLLGSMLVITAWPYAGVHLWGYDEKNTRIFQPLRLDETGVLTIAFKETTLAQFADRAFTMDIRWRGMPVSESVTCYTPRSIHSDSILIERHDTSLHVMANIVQGAVSSRILLVALGLRPWAGEIWQTTVPSNRDGWIDTTLGVDPSAVHWLLFFQQRSNQQIVFLGIYSLVDQHSPQSIDNDIQNGRLRSQWYKLIKLLDGEDLPHRLQHLIQRTHFEQFWDEMQQKYLVAYGWRELNTVALIDVVQHLLETGIQIPQAVCEWIPSVETANPHANVLAIHDLAHFKQTLHQLHQPVALEIRYAVDNSHRIDAHVQWELDEDDYKLRVCAPEKLSICPQCRLVLNQHTEHAHWTQSNTQCSSNVRHATKHQRVRVAVLLDIWVILHSFIKSVSAALYGRAVAPLWEQWIEDLHPYYEQSGQTNQRAWLEGFQRACLVTIPSPK